MARSVRLYATDRDRSDRQVHALVRCLFSLLPVLWIALRMEDREDRDLRIALKEEYAYGKR